MKFNNVLCKTSFWLLTILSCLSINCLANNTTTTAKSVAIIQLVEHPALNVTRQGILDQLKTSKVNIEFQSAQDNTILATQIAQKFVGAAPNVLVSIGTSATQALIAANKQQQIPIVFSSVTDPLSAKIVKNLVKPEGVVTGVSNFVDPDLQFSWFKKILPNLTKIGIIYNPGDANSVILLKKMEQTAAAQGLQLIVATANNSASVATATYKLITEVQAIFINNDNTALSAFDVIVKISDKHKIPVLCSDTDTVARGALAALGADQYAVGVQTGKLILQILHGAKPQQLPVVFIKKNLTKINLEQAAKLGINIPQFLITRGKHE